MLKGVVFIDDEAPDQVHFTVPLEQFQIRLPVAGEIVDIQLKGGAGQSTRFHVKEVRWLLRAGDIGQTDGERFDVHVYLKRQQIGQF